MSKDRIDIVVGKSGLFMCRIASLFLLQRLKGNMSGDARDFNNVETRAVIKFFFPTRQENSRVYRVSLSSTTQRIRSVARVLRKAASVLNLQSIRESSFQEITIIIVSVCYRICNTSSVISECNQKCELYNSVITCTQWRCQASYCVVTLTINWIAYYSIIITVIIHIEGTIELFVIPLIQQKLKEIKIDNKCY